MEGLCGRTKSISSKSTSSAESFYIREPNNVDKVSQSYLERVFLLEFLVAYFVTKFLIFSNPFFLSDLFPFPNWEVNWDAWKLVVCVICHVLTQLFGRKEETPPTAAVCHPPTAAGLA